MVSIKQGLVSTLHERISTEIKGTSYKIEKKRIKNKMEILLPNLENM